MKYLVNSDTSINLMSNLDKVMDSLFENTNEFNFQHPAVNVWEEDDKYLLEAELPGLTEKDIEVKIMDNLLTLSSVSNEKNREKKDNYLIKERKETSFSRSFVMPKNADKESINANFKNGILTLTIGKLPEPKPKNIKIEVN